MKWNNVKADIRPLSMVEAYGSLPVGDVLSLISTTKNIPFIYIKNKIKKQILEHLNTGKTELGGLLIGSVVAIGGLNDSIIAINVTDSIASVNFESTAVSLSMSSDVWESARKLSTPTSFVVGWYHSHPNLGAFFSGTDRKTQRDFFNSKYSVGLVIDPVRKEECCFLGEYSEEIPTEFIKVRDELALV